MATLETVLGEAQRIGLIGPGPLKLAIEHAERFVEAIPCGTRTVVDVGAGGGLPGLVVALRRVEIDMTLIDRRQRSVDQLRRSVVALGVSDRVRVVQADLADLARDPAWRGQYEVVTARGFGPPATVAEWALPLLAVGGRLVVSAAGAGENWPAEPLAALGARILSRDDGLVVLQAGPCPVGIPRPRGRHPLW